MIHSKLNIIQLRITLICGLFFYYIVCYVYGLYYYETKSKRNERNETKRNEILRNATKYTKLRNETQRNETKFTIMRNEMK